MDIVSPLPTSVAKNKLLFIATNYFSKWVEIEAYASIKDKDITKFVWKNIICRFEIPHAIVTDNGPQFNNSIFHKFCSKLKIKNIYSTPWYPQSNGQVEMANKKLLNSLKKQLEGERGEWVDKLFGVLWAYRTTNRRPTGVTLFALAYGMEVVIHTKIRLPTVRTTMQKSQANERNLEVHLDWVDEGREVATIRLASYQQRTVAHYNKRARPCLFHPSNMVLKRIFENMVEIGVGRL